MNSKITNAQGLSAWPIFIALFLPFAASFFYFVFFTDSFFAQLMYFGAKLFTVIWPLVVWKYVWRCDLPSARLLRPVGGDIFWGLTIGSLIVVAMVFAMGTQVGDVVIGSTPAIRAKVESLGVMNYYIPFAIFISVLHSLIEEYYWRLFVFGGLRKIAPPALAHILAAIGFSLHHFVVLGQYFPMWLAFTLGSFVGLGGLIWSLLFQRQNTLAGIWLSHMLVDFGILGIGYFLLF